MTPDEIAKLTPELQLRMWLLKHGYPHEHIPMLLRYCPQLASRFSIREIALAALSETTLFKPARTAILIRPFVMLASRQDLEVDETITDYVEQSMAIFASETIELTLANMIETLLLEKGLKPDDTC
jgi:hypothetical protein